eukprot:symbB.v1.2.008344.t1/scaffold507.1/size305965/14
MEVPLHLQRFLQPTRRWLLAVATVLIRLHSPMYSRLLRRKPWSGLRNHGQQGMHRSWALWRMSLSTCGRRLGQTWVGSMPSWLAIRQRWVGCHNASYKNFQMVKDGCGQNKSGRHEMRLSVVWRSASSAWCGLVHSPKRVGPMWNARTALTRDGCPTFAWFGPAPLSCKPGEANLSGFLKPPKIACNCRMEKDAKHYPRHSSGPPVPFFILNVGKPKMTSTRYVPIDFGTSSADAKIGGDLTL